MIVNNMNTKRIRKYKKMKEMEERGKEKGEREPLGKWERKVL